MLVVGAGIIGLASVAALKALFPRCQVTVLARHAHQAGAATACGADHVVMTDSANGHYESWPGWSTPGSWVARPTSCSWVAFPTWWRPSALRSR